MPDLRRRDGDQQHAGGGAVGLRHAGGLRGPAPHHPDDGAPVWLKTGQHGPFVAWRRRYVSLPKDVAPEDLTLERALALLEGPR